MTPKFLLASTSPGRRALLAKLGLAFEQVNPGVDETELDSEPARARASRLAEAKARAVDKRYDENALMIIGSDQVAHVDGQILPKPGDYDHAFEQLKSVSGHWVTFSTAICLVYKQRQRLAGQTECYTQTEDFLAKFRFLDEQEIRHYLQLEQPWDCAGSLKAESLGIALLENTRGRDINTLYGLPLMLLNEMLTDHGINIITDIT